MTMHTCDAARRALAAAIADRVFPAAVADVGSSAGSLWREGLGTLTFDAAAPAVDEATPFDLASLTKPIATTTVMMALAADGRVRLDERVAGAFSEWRGRDREAATMRDLMEHCAGLPARLVDAPPEGRRAFEHDICATPLEYAPRARSIYSDLDFILLGFLAADRGGDALDAQFARLRDRVAAAEPDLSRGVLTFRLDVADRRRAAPTVPLPEDRRRGRMLVGEVHDNYAAALGGVAGHAGLFGTARAVAAFARAVLRAARGDETIPAPLSPALVRLATTKTTVPGSSRALGWDTMLPTSSCGTRMSPSAFGHVGFTGPSLWIDPARDRYFVLLTNRAAGHAPPAAVRDTWRAFHDALADA